MAATVLDCMMASGVDFAVLHSEAAVANGKCTSDVDLVTRTDARTVVARMLGHLRIHNLHPVVVWPYDVGSASVFVVDAHADHGAQFDILHDWAGRGHYGVRAGEILAHAQPGVCWNRASPNDELLYLIRKRLHKHEQDRLVQLSMAAQDGSTRHLCDRARELFSSPSADAVVSVLSCRDQPSDTFRLVREAVENGGRIASRLRQPVGFWVAVDGVAAQTVAQLIARRFARVLPLVDCSRTSSTPCGLLRGARDIARVRWRAGVYSSWGPRPRMIRPDLVVRYSDGTEEQVLSQVVSAMERRLRL